MFSVEKRKQLQTMFIFTYVYITITRRLSFWDTDDLSLKVKPRICFLIIDYFLYNLNLTEHY